MPSMGDGTPLFKPTQYAAGFTLNLYCDRVHKPALDNTATFVGRNFSDCANQAKSAGWRMSAATRTATCPLHHNK